MNRAEMKKHQSEPSTDRDRKRLFVGISLPVYLKLRILRLRRPIPEFRWTLEGNLHLTLRYIGEVDVPLAARIEEILRSIRVEPFILPVKGIGCFPRRGPPRILWVGCHRGHPRLFQLHKRIDDSLITLGIEAERRAYHPHVTIARTAKAKPGAIKQFIHDHRDFETAPFKVEGFNLFSSMLSTQGPIYTPEATVCFL